MTERENAPDLSKVLPLIDEHYEEILAAAAVQYDMDRTKAERLYRHLWVYSHGIASLCATGVSHMTQEELYEMLQDVRLALVSRIKTERV